MSPTQLESDHAEQLEASLWSDPFLGALAQAANPNGVPARSNCQYLGVASHSSVAIAATGVVIGVPVPCVAGDVISTLTFPIGGTAAVTPTHQFGALYSASGALLAQSADGTNTAIPANTPKAYNLASAVTVTPAMLSSAGVNGVGYLIAALSITAGTVPTVYGVAVGSGYAWVTGMPLFAQTFGSAVGGTAPASITSPAAAANAPYVVLS